MWTESTAAKGAESLIAEHPSSALTKRRESRKNRDIPAGSKQELPPQTLADVTQLPLSSLRLSPPASLSRSPRKQLQPLDPVLHSLPRGCVGCLRNIDQQKVEVVTVQVARISAKSALEKPQLFKELELQAARPENGGASPLVLPL